MQLTDKCIKRSAKSKSEVILSDTHSVTYSQSAYVS